MNILEEIINYKKQEVEKKKSEISLSDIKKQALSSTREKHCFSSNIKSKIDKKEIALITEVKKASPSKGIIREDFNPIEIAKNYEEGGATCLSVLTDEKYFKGHLKYIKEIKDSGVTLPILRKDFIVNEYQIHEAIANQSDCILLIASALEKDNFKKLFETGSENEIDILIEVHNEREMDTSLEILSSGSKTPMIGINNRDLKTFITDLNTSKELVKKYKRDLTDKIIVSESGIFTPNDIKTLVEDDIFCFLIGESLMREKDIKEATKKLLGIKA